MSFDFVMRMTIVGSSQCERGVGVNLKFPTRLLFTCTLRYPRELRDDDVRGYGSTGRLSSVFEVSIGQVSCRRFPIFEIFYGTGGVVESLRLRRSCLLIRCSMLKFSFLSSSR